MSSVTNLGSLYAYELQTADEERTGGDHEHMQILCAQYLTCARFVARALSICECLSGGVQPGVSLSTEREIG